ncbi:hypothetical protein JEQ12_005045 [Ovis aries]|uniref:MARVEL domain-containing protein n=1 Tax=Ovis aries TaxID=9940 RepID=A0A836A374_SHEEP|nr:hypothetical protein JEQ12_005045 [Ovis aries]
MDAQKLNPPSKGLKSRATLSRSVHIAEGPHPERSGRSTLSEHGVSAAPSASLLKQPATLSQEEKEAIQKRAEGRAKVPPKFRDSIKRFFFSPTGALKIIRLGLLIGAFIFFIIAEAPESYIAITILETCIVVFFILIYMLTLHHLMTYLHWPLLDLINSFITAVFLVIVAILAIQEKERRHLFYIGGGCLIGSLIMFTGTTVHPILTLIITMEISIFIFFIIIYTFAIQRYVPFILWPISDLLNDLFSCGFLVGGAVFAIRSRQTVPPNYVTAVVFIGVAALFALVDVCLQKKHFKGKKVKRNVLVPPPPKEPEKPKPAEKTAEEGKKKEAAKPKDTKAKPDAKKGEADKGKAKGGKK